MGYEAMIAKSDWILQKIAFKAVVNVVLIRCFSHVIFIIKYNLNRL